MPFNVDEARKSGYSDAEIANYLGTTRGFDVAGARKSGYKDSEIIEHLTKGQATFSPPTASTPIDSVAPEIKTGVGIQRPGIPERFTRGLLDVGQGAKQAWLMATDRPAAKEYTEQVNKELAQYNDRRDDKENNFDIVRAAGSAAPFIPLAPLSPEGLLGRIAVGAASGAASGLTNFAPSGTWQEKGGNALLGAAAGGVSTVGADYLTRALRSGAGKAASATAKVANKLTGTVEHQLQAQFGEGWDSLDDAIKAKLMRDASAQLAATGKLDAESLARSVDIQRIGAKGTVGSITRDPAQWSFERNAAKIDMSDPVSGFSVNPLVGRFQEDDAAMKSALTSLVPQGKSKTDFQAATSAISAIQKADSAAEKVVDDLYEAYRSTGQAGKIAVPDTKIADALGRVADEYGTENIPAAVLNRLKSYGFMDGQRTKLLTIQEADKLNKLINNNRPPSGPTSRALKIIKDAVNESLLDVPEEGSGTSTALLSARKEAAKRFAEQRSGKAVDAAIKDVAPDNFFSRYVVNGDVREIDALRKSLSKTHEGAQAWNDLRSRTAQYLLDKATSGDPVGGQFSGSRLSKAISDLGDDKLRQIFSQEEIDQLGALARASVALTKEPPFSVVNHSNTTPVLANVLSYTSKVPFVGSFLSGVMSEGMKVNADLARKNAIMKALESRAISDRAVGAARSEAAKQLARRVSGYAPAISAALLMEPSKNKTAKPQE